MKNLRPFYLAFVSREVWEAADAIRKERNMMLLEKKEINQLICQHFQAVAKDIQDNMLLAVCSNVVIVVISLVGELRTAELRIAESFGNV